MNFQPLVLPVNFLYDCQGTWAVHFRTRNISLLDTIPTESPKYAMLCV